MASWIYILTIVIIEVILYSFDYFCNKGIISFNIKIWFREHISQILIFILSGILIIQIFTKSNNIIYDRWYTLVYSIALIYLNLLDLYKSKIIRAYIFNLQKTNINEKSVKEIFTIMDKNSDLNEFSEDKTENFKRVKERNKLCLTYGNNIFRPKTNLSEVEIEFLRLQLNKAEHKIGEAKIILYKFKNQDYNKFHKIFVYEEPKVIENKINIFFKYEFVLKSVITLFIIMIPFIIDFIIFTINNPTQI